MHKPILALCIASSTLFAAAQAQACTQDEATAKAQELAAKVEEITQRDPQRAALLREELREAGPQTEAEKLGTDCDAYDQRLTELEQLGAEVEEQAD